MITKKQHYVPQFYLYQFYNKKVVNVYDKRSDQIRINQSIRNIAHQRYFFDIENLELKSEIKKNEVYEELSKLLTKNETINQMLGKNKIEELFSEIENIFAPILKEFVEEIEIAEHRKEMRVKDNASFFIYIYLFIGLQFVRTESFRQNNLKLVGHIQKTIGNIGADNGFHELGNQLSKSLSYPKELSKLLHANKLLDSEFILAAVKFLMKCECNVLYNKTGKHFITSDSPVSVFSLYTDEKIKFPIICENIGIRYILFPINKNICLKFYYVDQESDTREWYITDVDSHSIIETNNYIASCANEAIFFDENISDDFEIIDFDLWLPEIRIK